MLRYWTAGESHGKALIALVDGFPAGLKINKESIDADLQLRQGGYGRGGRQKLETDTVDFLTGVWQMETLGSPLTLQVVNNDYKLERLKELERPRPDMRTSPVPSNISAPSAAFSNDRALAKPQFGSQQALWPNNSCKHLESMSSATWWNLVE